MPLALGVPGLPELLVLLVVVLVVMGPKRLTGVGKSLGANAREFKESLTGDKDDDEQLAAAPREPVVRPADVAARPAAPPSVAPPVAPRGEDEETVTGEPVDAPRRTPRA